MIQWKNNFPLTTNIRIATVILAAGASTRMGKPKQTLKWGETTLLGHCIDQVLASKAQEVILILGANHELIKEKIENYALDILINENWQAGMGSSIALAAKQLLKSNVDGVLIVLADQPNVDSHFLNSLMRRFHPEKNTIIATNYGDGAGVPVLFDQTYIEKLSRLEGDQGAKRIIQEAVEFVTSVTPDFRLTDIDTPEAYEALYNYRFNNEE